MFGDLLVILHGAAPQRGAWQGYGSAPCIPNPLHSSAYMIGVMQRTELVDLDEQSPAFSETVVRQFSTGTAFRPVGPGTSPVRLEESVCAVCGYEIKDQFVLRVSRSSLHYVAKIEKHLDKREQRSANDKPSNALAHALWHFLTRLLFKSKNVHICYFYLQIQLLKRTAFCVHTEIDFTPTGKNAISCDF
ncbi:unnamed protein product [Cylicostephanus goldi]|uniref:Uncharacterized protein n=1 Tax=Cylicostephanus goldi TaxID=71465 RepID=A0A3P6RQX4_CYLGO|nr:unnamed protein product [Cylicostephanus goldi]